MKKNQSKVQLFSKSRNSSSNSKMCKIFNLLFNLSKYFLHEIISEELENFKKCEEFKHLQNKLDYQNNYFSFEVP